MQPLPGIVSHFPDICRLFTGGLLLLSGFGKLADLVSFGQVLQDFGVSDPRGNRSLTIIIPGLECVLGGGLVLGGLMVPVVAAAASGLFTILAIVTARTLIQGRTPQCGCFGRLSRKEVTWLTVRRNVALAGLATMMSVRFASDVPQFGTGLSALFMVSAIAVGTTVAAEVLGVLRVGWSLRRPSRFLTRGVGLKS